MELTLLVVLVIVLALFFDFTNGFHDTANAMATPIATGALKPKVAVTIAAILNLVGAFLSTEVARTISGGIIKEGEDGILITPELIFAGLLGAIVWNMITWLLGLPSSSSHALFGGLIGATLVGFGVQAIDFSVVLSKVVLPAVLAPLTAGLIAYTATKLAYAVTRRYDGKPDGRSGFRYGQIFSSSLVALAHGTNDAQKTMGVITLLLISVGLQPVGSGPEFWVVVVCAVAIALGTYMGGWRIIKTLGTGLTDVKPAQGFAAETATAATILASTNLGFALSTTQVASGSVIGLRARPPRLEGALGHGGPHRHRLAPDPPGRRHRRRHRGARRDVGGRRHRDRHDRRRRRDHRHLPVVAAQRGLGLERRERGRRLGPGREDQAEPQAEEQGGAVIDWLAFLLVLGSALLATVIVVTTYSLGLRLLTVSGRTPIVTPAEFTDAITVISPAEAKAAAEKAAKAAQEEPAHRRAEACGAHRRPRLLRRQRRWPCSSASTSSCRVLHDFLG